jgi:replicative DNA helicase
MIDSKSHHLYTAPIYIDDTPSLSLIELRAKARRLKQKQKIELLVIDYLQLMSCEVGTGGNREQEISTISRGLKALSKELQIPIIALSQLSRQVESRPGSSYKPKLSDLRESGAIEQDADVVMFCYRPTYYGIEDYEYENERFIGDSCKELLEIIIAKNRHGSLGSVMLGFIAELTKITDWDWGSGRAKNVPIEYYMPKDLENKNKNSTFVQPDTKLSENNGFLAQKSVENSDDGEPF